MNRRNPVSVEDREKNELESMRSVWATILLAEVLSEMVMAFSHVRPTSL
jgi:hypothetical protein